MGSVQILEVGFLRPMFQQPLSGNKTKRNREMAKDITSQILLS